MTDIALFHSVLGVRPGVSEAADRLRAEGHDVVVVDQYGGRVFDDYEEADEFAQAVGYPGAGHLFTDASLPKEYDVQATDLLWSPVLPFCAPPPQEHISSSASRGRG